MKRNPDIGNEKHMLFMQDIRHANINANWSRESSTVKANFAQVKKLEKVGTDMFGIPSVTPVMGPFPLEDTFGMAIAACLLRRSLDPGRNENTIQFATARRFRSAFSNAYHASKNVGNISSMAYEANKFYTTTCPTYGYWFARFILGCHKRMGDKVVQDYALSRKIFLELLRHLEDDWNGAHENPIERDGIAEFAGVLLIGFLLGLRGEEIVKTDISGLLKYIDVGALDPDHPHVIIPLIGRLKGETGERYHMLPMARVTRSGIMAGKWMDRLCRSLLKQDRRNGFVFLGKDGNPKKIREYNEEFYERLRRVRVEKWFLFEPGIDISDEYGLRRSLRRGSNTEARNRKVSQPVIDMNNRWRKWEGSKGRRPAMEMSAHYTEIRMSLPILWEYSFSF
ncbi:unnamed protein product [Cylindrotheca closterium]|nr:unnamed protein product [Cylindrotheca closterium]